MMALCQMALNKVTTSTSDNMLTDTLLLVKNDTMYIKINLDEKTIKIKR